MFGQTILQTLFLASVICQINFRGSGRKLLRGNLGARIAGGFTVGSSANNRLYPFMARMVMDGAHKCGGSVISERIIATSRHCLKDCPCFPKQDWHLCPNICFIKLRETSDSQADTETIHTIQAVHLPGNSGAPDNFADYFSSDVTDFALVQLTRSVNDCEETSSSRDCWPISPVHLVGPETLIRKGDTVRTIGWGATFWEESSEFLQQLNLKINSNSKFEYIIETDITPDGGDTCSGDSGGPLLLRNSKTYEWILVATLLGGGHNCDSYEPHNPKQDKTGDWNKVTPHLKWIERVVSSTSATDSPTTTHTPTTTTTVRINGKWSNWAGWTSCSSAGWKKRKRQCNNPAPLLPPSCLGISQETKGCPGNSCKAWNLNIPHKDITHVGNVTTWEKCSALCSQNNECLFWSWVDTNFAHQDYIHKCWLKNGYPESSPTTGVVSGNSACKPDECIVEFGNTNSPGNDIDTVSNVATSEECHKLCMERYNQGCSFWSWVHDSYTARPSWHHKCFLKSTGWSNMRSEIGVVSGAHIC